jgi:HNH endonuclease/NUMOD4 motif
MRDDASGVEVERWVEIADWPDYAVSSLGRIKRLTTYGRGIAGTIRKTQKLSATGYQCVALTHRSGRRKLLLVHRLVAMAFLGPPPSPAHEVNHKDADRWNCRLDNLEWMTKGENRKHGYEVGFADARGERNGYASLTWAAVRLIRTEAAPDRSNWPALADRFEVSKTTIRDVVSFRTWREGDPLQLAA